MKEEPIPSNQVHLVAALLTLGQIVAFQDHLGNGHNKGILDCFKDLVQKLKSANPD